MTQAKKKVSIAFVGHQHSGKSSLLGRLLSEFGTVSGAKLKEIEQQAAKRDKRNSKYAMVVDKDTEWDSGHTEEPKIRRITTYASSMVLIDVPGCPKHQREVVSALSGTDAIVLVVDATSDGFAAGMSKNGQTREHALLAYVLGIRNVVVAINKLDLVPAASMKKRYEECKAEVLRYLKRVGLNQPERIAVVPMSAVQGHNVAPSLSSWSWHKGATIVDALDAVEASKRSANGPLRCVVFSIHQKDSSAMYQGRVEYGTLRIGMALSIMPGGIVSELQQLEVTGATAQSASPGDLVAFTTQSSPPLETGQGCMISDASNPCQLTKSFIGQVIQLHGAVELAAHVEVLLEVCTSSVPCRVVELQQKIDRRSGKIMEESPEVLKADEVAFCKFEPLQPVVLESCVDFPMLGRFCLRHNHLIAAVGLIKSVEHILAA